MPPRIALLILLSVVLAFAIWPTPAGAGPYDVHACRLPDGTRIPAKGWQPFRSAHVESVAINSCGGGGALEAGFNAGGALKGWEAGWSFVAPPATQISAVSLSRLALSEYFPVYPSSLEYLATLDEWPTPAGPTVERCVATSDTPCDVSLSRPFERAGLRHASLSIGLRCTEAGGCYVPSRPGLTTQMEIQAARVTLDDPVPPAFASSPILDGTQAAVAVTDIGAGVSTVRIDLDGRLVGRSEPACVPPFLEPVPCPARKDVKVPLDLASLSDGEHTLIATAVDASGNTTSAPVAFTTHGGHLVASSPLPVVAPPLVGEVALRMRAWFKGKSRAVVRTLGYGERAVVEGTLADATGRAVANAAVAVSERVIGVTSSRRPAPVRTDAKGRFSYRLGVGPSRVVEFSSGAATARVTVRVRAGVTLRTSANRVRNGSALRFSGRVLGRQRALVTIYALSSGPRKRIPVETVRAGSSGRFSYTYRFARILGPSVYRFEARVPKQTGFPYLDGVSPRVTVRGRP